MSTYEDIRDDYLTDLQEWELEQAEIEDLPDYE